MTPQTAAALKALEADIRYNAKRFLHMQALFRWADELAAVLTQEGARARQPDGRCYACGWPYARNDEHGCVPGDCSYRPSERDPTYPRWHARMQEMMGTAPAEPRAAEGAGMDGVVRPLGSPSDYSYGSLEDGLNLAAELNGTKPTAAAAVPAGGDAFDSFCFSALDPRTEPAKLDGRALPLLTVVLHAVCGNDQNKFELATLAMRKAFEAGQAAPVDAAIVGYLVSPNARAHPNAKEELVFDKPMYRPDWNVFPLTLAARAPMGRVTDDIVFVALDAYTNACPAAYSMPYVPALRAALEAALTPPAAQAQDAGPKARHWREAVSELGNTPINRIMDSGPHLQAGSITIAQWIEQRAHALAAKEAK